MADGLRIAIEEALRPGDGGKPRLVMVVSPNVRRARMAFERLMSIVPLEMLKKIDRPCRRVEFAGGGSIRFIAPDHNAVMGLSPSYVLVDNAGGAVDYDFIQDVVRPRFQGRKEAIIYGPVT